VRTLTLLPTGIFDAFVSAVHDGDTVRVLLPVEVKIRLDGIQVAELSTPKGKEEAAWLKARIEGKWVQLDLLGDYKFGGERMGRVIVDGVDVGAEMVKAGRAVAWDGRGPRPVGSNAGE
jgi:endonuclease YncB( thermonuclease family)